MGVVKCKLTGESVCGCIVIELTHVYTSKLPYFNVINMFNVNINDEKSDIFIYKVTWGVNFMYTFIFKHNFLFPKRIVNWILTEIIGVDYNILS